MSRLRSPFSLVFVAIAVGVVTTRLQDRVPFTADDAMDPATASVASCPQAVGATCDESLAFRPAADEVVLPADSVCVNVGYLCAELETAGSQRILRWPEDTGRLRVRVPLPTGVSPRRARDLQSAAVRGIQYWQRRPFELVIDTHPVSSYPPDIEIKWGEGLSGSQLGLTQVRWSLERGEAKFEILGMSLAMRSPTNTSIQLPPEQVLLTAAHEMGHALGMPHSDSQRDVMYPTNTARNLSNRDFRTVSALYSLPNGAEIAR